jgi:hypothetical protein
LVKFSVRRIRWPHAIRIVGSRELLQSMFELVERAEDYEQILALEARTSEVARNAASIVATIPPAERYVGPGADVVMAPFILPRRSRFSDGSYGVLYVADDLDTAIAETRHHRARALTDARMAPVVVPLEAYSMTLAAPVQDIRLTASPAPPRKIYDPENYTASRRLGHELRDAGARALHYSSVRRPGSACIGAYYATHASHVRRTMELHYHWDGAKIDRVSVTR